jgi:acyl-CoA reductase-like NAD-dependent aldehyde dehydrogenase
MQATVLDGVTSAMRIYSEESFGPVAVVIRVGSIDEAISVANDTEFGLAAAVFGRDAERAMAVARRLETGICHINAPTVYDEPQMPFGGVKASGYGRFGGEAGIHEFTELRWISVHGGKHAYPTSFFTNAGTNTGSHDKRDARKRQTRRLKHEA